MQKKLAAFAVAVLALALVAVFALSIDRRKADAPSPAPQAAGPEASSAAAVGPTRPQAAAPSTPSPAIAPPSASGRAVVVDDPSAANGVIHGRVLSSDNAAGVAGAELTFEQAGISSSCRTDAAGAYEFGAPKAGAWRVAAVAADGFLPFAPEWGHSPVVMLAAPGRRMEGATLWLKPQVAYRVQVLDPQGGKVAGAEVIVLSAATGDWALMPLPDRYVTDAKGEAEVRAPDHADLEARHPGWAPGRAEIDFAAQVSHRLVIRVAKLEGARAQPRSISGQVVDPSGAPVAGAVVAAGGKDHSPAQATTDDGGRFRLNGLNAGRYHLDVQHEQFAPAEVSDVEAGTANLVVRLEAGCRLHGEVRDRSGAPVIAFTVLAWRKAGLFTKLEQSAARFDPQGEFDLDGLPCGSLLVTAIAPGLAESADVPVELAAPPAPPARASIVLDAGARIAGVVVERSTQVPLAGAHVTIEGRQGDAESPAVASARRMSGYTDREGRFSIDGVRAGRMSLVAEAASHHGRIIGGIEVPERGDVPPLRIEMTRLDGNEEPRVELTGLGIVLNAKGDGIFVAKVFPNGGGAQAGLQPGDQILSVDGRPVRELGFEGTMGAIRGPENTEIRLEMKRAADGAVVAITAVRRFVRG